MEQGYILYNSIIYRSQNDVDYQWRAQGWSQGGTRFCSHEARKFFLVPPPLEVWCPPLAMY